MSSRVRRWAVRSGRGVVLASAILPALCAAAWAAQTLFVLPKEAKIRRDKTNFKPAIATVKQGDALMVIASSPPWIEVEAAGVRGFIHASAVTEDRKVAVSGRQVASGTRPSEASAAGRGFDKEIEAKRRSDHPDLESLYKLVQAIEDTVYSEERIFEFLRAGRLAHFSVEGGE
jgi:hypothetical protein